MSLADLLWIIKTWTQRSRTCHRESTEWDPWPRPIFQHRPGSWVRSCGPWSYCTCQPATQHRMASLLHKHTRSYVSHRVTFYSSNTWLATNTHRHTHRATALFLVLTTTYNWQHVQTTITDHCWWSHTYSCNVTDLDYCYRPHIFN